METFNPHAREAARIFLEVKNVRCERVKDTNAEDIQKEGITKEKNCKNKHPEYCDEYYPGGIGGWNKCNFMYFWDSLNAKRGYSWNSNPWVWVIEFEKVKR